MKVMQVVHGFHGQVRVEMSESCIRTANDKPKFIEIPEQVRLKETAVSA